MLKSNINNWDSSTKSGLFTINHDKEVFGELTFAGPNTKLHLKNEKPFDFNALENYSVTGILFDNTKVTLLDCLVISAPVETQFINEHDQVNYYYVDVFPHYIVFGEYIIVDNEKTIHSLNFTINDAHILFYDFDTFGSLINPHPFIEQIIEYQIKQLNRKIELGPHPEIIYYNGKNEIFTSSTVIGKITATHKPTTSWGGPQGAYIKNKIYMSIILKEACTLRESINKTLRLLNFIEMIIGRSQNLLDLNVSINEEYTHSVYWCMKPRYEHDTWDPQPADILINGGAQPDSFSAILTKWFERDDSWLDARNRFNSCFCNNGYTIDRLVGAANMFDILPNSALPPEYNVSDNLKKATDTCTKEFHNLPQSPERDSVLSALGRVGKNNLKNKIRYRAEIIINDAEEWFPELFIVTDEAVNCRNHYVHGSKQKIDYSKESDMPIFFTQTLEFVFAASDLIESGWDLKAWCEIGTSMTHSFGEYRVNYHKYLQRLKYLLK